METARSDNLNEDGIVDINSYTLQIINETCPNMDPVTMAVTAVRLIDRAKVEVERREKLRKMEKGHLQLEKDIRRDVTGYRRYDERQTKNAYATDRFKRKLPEIYLQGNDAKKPKLNIL